MQFQYKVHMKVDHQMVSLVFISLVSIPAFEPQSKPQSLLHLCLLWLFLLTVDQCEAHMTSETLLWNVQLFHYCNDNNNLRKNLTQIWTFFGWFVI